MLKILSVRERETGYVTSREGNATYLYKCSRQNSQYFSDPASETL